MKRYKLSDIAKEVTVRENNPADSEYRRFVGLEHYEQGEIVIRKYGSTNDVKSAMKVFCNGDVLVARRNVYLRRAAIVNFDGLTSGDSIVLRANNDKLSLLLPFILNTSKFWSFAEQNSDGTMSKRLSPKKLMDYEFNLPSDREQDRIIELLWSIDRTRQAYRQLLFKTDELVKSQFIEMLSPYVDAGKVIALEDMVQPDRPITYGIVKPGTNVEGGVPVVRVKDFTDGTIHTEDMLHTSHELNSKYLRSTLLEGDVLLSIGGTIGRVAIVPEKLAGANITQHTARISLKEQYDPVYIKGLLESPIMQETMSKNTLGVAQIGLNLRDIRKFHAPDVPAEIQKELSDLYKQSDKSKLEIQKALTEISLVNKHIICDCLS